MTLDQPTRWGPVGGTCVRKRRVDEPRVISVQQRREGWSSNEEVQGMN